MINEETKKINEKLVKRVDELEKRINTPINSPGGTRPTASFVDIENDNDDIIDLSQEE